MNQSIAKITVVARVGTIAQIGSYDVQKLAVGGYIFKMPPGNPIYIGMIVLVPYLADGRADRAFYRSRCNIEVRSAFGVSHLCCPILLIWVLQLLIDDKNDVVESTEVAGCSHASEQLGYILRLNIFDLVVRIEVVHIFTSYSL